MTINPLQTQLIELQTRRNGLVRNNLDRIVKINNIAVLLGEEMTLVRWPDIKYHYYRTHSPELGRDVIIETTQRQDVYVPRLQDYNFVNRIYVTIGDADYKGVEFEINPNTTTRVVNYTSDSNDGDYLMDKFDRQGRITEYGNFYIPGNWELCLVAASEEANRIAQKAINANLQKQIDFLNDLLKIGRDDI